MLPLILKYIVKALVIATPYVAPVLLKMRITDHLPWIPAGVLPEELVKGLLSFCALGLTFTGDALNVRMPQEEAKEFGKTYVADVLRKFKEGLPQDVKVGPDLRANVMFVKRVWWLLYIGKRFYWFANAGFEPTDGDGRQRDAHLSLWTFQGLAGQAFVQQEMLSADLRNTDMLGEGSFAQRHLLRNRFRLTNGQLRRTRLVKAIVSVPIYRQVAPEPNTRWKVVGVINIDAISAEGARWLLDERNLQATAGYFGESGTVIAFFAGTPA